MHSFDFSLCSKQFIDLLIDILFCKPTLHINVLNFLFKNEYQVNSVAAIHLFLHHRQRTFISL